MIQCWAYKDKERRHSYVYWKKKELKKLESMYQEDTFQFAVIYGRRRIGKTTLISEFLKDKKAISYIAIEGTMKENLAGLSLAVMRGLSDGNSFPEAVYPDFESLLSRSTSGAGNRDWSLPLTNTHIWRRLIPRYPRCCRNTLIPAGKTVICF